MSWPTSKAGPSVVAVDAQERGGGGGGGGGGGARSHPGMVSPGWGLSTLRLLWNNSRGWTLHHSCSRRRIRRCLGTLSRRVACSSPGSARAIYGKGTSLTLGPGSMPSTGLNHGWRTAEGPKRGGRAIAERRGRGELSTSGSRVVRCAAACGRGRLLDVRWGAGGADHEAQGLRWGGERCERE